MLESLTSRLAKIAKRVRGEARLTEANIQEALREVRVALLEADVALPVVKHFIDSVRAKARAPVSMPIDWSELSHDVRFDRFNVKNVPEIVAKRKRDP